MTNSVPVKIAILLFVLISVLTAQTASLPKKVLALNELYFSAINTNDAAQITETIFYNIKNFNTYNLMDRYEMKNALNQTGYQQTSICARPSCALEIGQLLNVDLVAIGSVSQIGSTYSIGINIIDIRTGRTVKEVNDFYKGNISKLLNHGIPIITSKLCGITQEQMVVKRKVKKSVWYWILGSIIAVSIPVTIIFTNDD